MREEKGEEKTLPKYVIIKTGGNKQHLVRQGDEIDVDLLSESGEKGDKIEFKDVLFAFDGKQPHVGKPALSAFSVHGEVVGTAKGEKITSLKYKPSHNQCRKWGHRQKYTRVKITGIESKQK